MTDAPPPEDEGLEAGETGDFDNFEAPKKGTLGDLWRDNAMFKVGVVVAAAVIIFGAIILFGGPAEKPQLSITPGGSEVSAPPGTESASPAYVEQVKEQNEKRTEEAQKNGTSSLPTPIEPPVGRLAIPEEEATNEDPLQRWRKLQEERLERELQKTQSIAPENAPEDANRQQAIQQLASQMVTQMQAILDSKNQVHVNYKSLTDPSWLDEREKKQQDAEDKAAAAASNAQTLDENDLGNTQVILFPAGEIAYAQTLIAADSDAPDPVLAQIAGGPLNGARLLGNFAVDQLQDGLTINFNTIVINGISYGCNGFAIDPATTLPDMPSDVDHHYLKRVVLPMAASFVSGLASAIDQSGRTDVTIATGSSTTSASTTPSSDKQEVSAGVTNAGTVLQQFLTEENGRTNTTVILKAGTVMGILFTDAVIKSDDNIKVATVPGQPSPYASSPIIGAQAATLRGAASAAAPLVGALPGAAQNLLQQQGLVPGQYPQGAYGYPGATGYPPYAPR